MQKLADTTYPDRTITQATLEPACFRRAPGRDREAPEPLGSGPLVGFLRQSTALVFYCGHQGGAS